MSFNHILWLNMEPNNCVLIQWPSPCLAQVGTLNAITLKSSIKENGFHTFVGGFIFPKKVCIWGRKETCLFWKLDTFPGQGRYLSSSTYVTKNSQVLAEEIPWLLSSNGWRSCGPETRHDCVSGATLWWWKTSGGVPVKPCEMFTSWRGWKHRQGLVFPCSYQCAKNFSFRFLSWNSNINTSLLYQKRISCISVI